jgi:hypothetical protein
MGGESLTTLGNILLVRRSAAAELTLAMLEIAVSAVTVNTVLPGASQPDQ